MLRWDDNLLIPVFITGIFLFIFSHFKLKGLEYKGYLVKKGIYSTIRNLMYLGFIKMKILL